MAAIAGVTSGPPVHWGNAAGRALIGELVRFPTGAALDTLAFVSKYLEEIVAIIGNVTFSAPVKDPNGATTTMKISDAVPATEFMDVLVIGYARRVHSGGAV